MKFLNYIPRNSTICFMGCYGWAPTIFVHGLIGRLLPAMLPAGFDSFFGEMAGEASRAVHSVNRSHANIWPSTTLAE